MISVAESHPSTPRGPTSVLVGVMHTPASKVIYVPAYITLVLVWCYLIVWLI